MAEGEEQQDDSRQVKSLVTDDDYKNDETTRSAASLSYILVFLLVGIPVWWKTTEVYRVSLPYDDIHTLSSTQISIPIDVVIAVCQDAVSNVELETLRKTFADKVSDTTREKLKVTFSLTVRQCTQQEYEIITGATSLSDAESKLDKYRSITIFALPSNSQLLPKDISVYAGTRRVLFVSSVKGLNSLCDTVPPVLQSTIVDLSLLFWTYDRLSDVTRRQSQLDKRSLTRLPSTTAVDVTFTLMLPDPSHVHVYWDIQNATSIYLMPFVKKLQDIVHLDIKSQVFYLKMLDITAHYNSHLNHYVLNYDRLPHIINPIESKLGSHVSTNPALNFVVYVPPPHQSPLQIHDDKGKPSPLNAFLIPRWGGILFYNINQSSDPSIDLLHVLGVFLPQLRSLLGIPQASSSPFVIFSDLDRTLLRDWELDAMVRVRMVDNILTSISTLQSLAQLLEQIGNIVIADHVGDQIHRATLKIKESISRLETGDIMSAFLSSKDALIASEAAFFDKSMLALLYFPDDQKYAIYVPLFLPVCLPLVFSVLPVTKWLRNKFKKTKVEKVD